MVYAKDDALAADINNGKFMRARSLWRRNRQDGKKE